MQIQIHLINTGSELMLGRILNTHQQWICRQLADRGFIVSRQVAVDDSGPAIQQAVRESLAVAELVIVTGGLGPTSDDRTRDLVAELLGRTLHEDPAIVAHIEKFFSARRRSMPATTRVQALVPEGASVLMNSHGTAPGLAMTSAEGRLLVMLPGPPRELHPMFLDQVAPLLLKVFPAPRAFACRTLKTTGLGESLVEERVAPVLAGLVQRGLEIGYCARVGEVEVRVSARGGQAHTLVAEAEGIVRDRLNQLVYGADDDSLEAVVLRMLKERKQTVALAESCTGGYIAHRLTNVPGASEVFPGGLVTYSNQAKQDFAGVRAETLGAHGAVSEATVLEMATGARTRFRADYALAVSGIAGPGGGTAEKPVGTVWIGLATAKRTRALHKLNPVDRETFKYVTCQQALDLLRREMLGAES